MCKYYLFFILLISTQLEAVIVSAIKLKHPVTGKTAYLFADVHIKNELDDKQLEFVKTLLDSNKESDIFIDSMPSSSMHVNKTEIQGIENYLNNEPNRIKNTLSDSFLILTKNFSRKIDKKPEQYNSIIATFEEVILSYTAMLSIGSLLASTQLHCMRNKELNIIPDIRFEDSEEAISVVNELIQQGVQGISPENLKFVEEHRFTKPLCEMPQYDVATNFVEHTLSSYMDALELNIIQHLTNNNKKPIIAIIGAIHVNKLYSLLTSEAFGYVIDKEVKLEVITVKMTEDENGPIFKFEKELYEKYFEETDSSMVMKIKAVEECLNALEETGQILLTGYKGVPTEELEKFLQEDEVIIPENNAPCVTIN